MIIQNMTRGEFLWSSIALAAVPAATNGATGEKLQVNGVVIEAGVERPFSVLHVSDTHLTAVYPHEDRWKQEMSRADTPIFGARQEEALAEAIAYAKAHCNFLLHTGDLIDFVSEANLDLVRRYLPEGCLGALGNHEYSHYGWLVKKAGTAGPGREETRQILAKFFPFRMPIAAKEVNGVVFVAIDDADGTVSEDQVAQFRRIVKKGRPIILCMHVPFYTPGICLVGRRWWKKGTDAANPELKLPDFERQRSDSVTRDFIAALKREPLLKGILSGHLHLTAQDRFSPSAMQYVAGGNFSFLAQMVRVL